MAASVPGIRVDIDRSQRSDLAGQTVSQGQYNVTYGDNGYVTSYTNTAHPGLVGTANSIRAPSIDAYSPNRASGTALDQQYLSNSVLNKINDLRNQAQRGQISWKEANDQANDLRSWYGYGSSNGVTPTNPVSTYTGNATFAALGGANAATLVRLGIIDANTAKSLAAQNPGLTYAQMLQQQQNNAAAAQRSASAANQKYNTLQNDFNTLQNNYNAMQKKYDNDVANYMQQLLNQQNTFAQQQAEAQRQAQANLANQQSAWQQQMADQKSEYERQRAEALAEQKALYEQQQAAALAAQRAEYERQQELLRQQQAAKLEANLSNLANAYQQNMAGYNQQRDLLPQTYQNARNAATSQDSLARRMFDERAVAAGLSSGAAAQMELSRSAALQGALADIDQSQANALSNLNLQQQNLTTDYNNTVAEARAQNNSELASALYQELLREQDQQREDLRYNQQYQNDLAKLAAGYGDYSLLNQLGINTANYEYQQAAAQAIEAAERQMEIDNNAWSRAYQMALTGAEYGDYSGLNRLGINTDGYRYQQEIERTQAAQNDAWSRAYQMALLGAQYGDYTGLNNLGVNTANYESQLAAERQAAADAAARAEQERVAALNQYSPTYTPAQTLSAMTNAQKNGTRLTGNLLADYNYYMYGDPNYSGAPAAASGVSNSGTASSGSSGGRSIVSYNNGSRSGSQIKQMQAALGVTQDGYWGPATQSASKSRWGTTSADEAWKQFSAGGTSGGSSGAVTMTSSAALNAATAASNTQVGQLQYLDQLYQQGRITQTQRDQIAYSIVGPSYK